MITRFYNEGKRTLFTVNETSGGWQLKHDGAAAKVHNNKWYVYFKNLEMAADWVGCYLNGLATWDEAGTWVQTPAPGNSEVLGITYKEEEWK